MAQVKFYSVGANAAKTDTGGVYFVDGGELYKGTQRFGANKVFTKGEGQNLASFSQVGQIGGDILVGIGAAKVWDPATGTNGSWVDLGADNTALQSSWRADISTWTAGLEVTGADSTSYVTYIDQDDDGKVTAHTENFVTKVKEAVGDGSSTSTVNGIGVEVVTTSGAVTSVAVTTTSADLKTFLGVTNVADKTVVTTVRASDTALDTALPTESAVRAAIDTAIGNMGQVMHFAGAGTTLPASAAAGDVYVFTGDATDSSGYKSGQEVVYTGSAWEVIGDQNSYALNAYAPGTETVTAGATTLPAATHAIASAVDMLNTNASLKASVGTGTSASYGVSGEVVLSANAQPTLSVEVAPVTTSEGIVTGATTSLATAGAIADYVDGKIGALGTAASMDYSTAVENDSTLPTGAAVTTFVGSQITTSINALSANVSSSNQTGLTVSVVETSGVITGVQAELVWLDAGGDPL